MLDSTGQPYPSMGPMSHEDQYDRDLVLFVDYEIDRTEISGAAAESDRDGDAADAFTG